MRRLSAFERDLQDLHGVRVRPIRAEIVQEKRPTKPASPRRGVDHIGLRLTLGVLGLFWSIVLIGVLGAMLVVAWAFVPPFVSALFSG